MEMAMDAPAGAIATEVAEVTAKVIQKYNALRDAGFGMCATESGSLCTCAKALVSDKETKENKVDCAKAGRKLSAVEADSCGLLPPVYRIQTRPPR